MSLADLACGPLILREEDCACLPLLLPCAPPPPPPPALISVWQFSRSVMLRYSDLDPKVGPYLNSDVNV